MFVDVLDKSSLAMYRLDLEGSPTPEPGAIIMIDDSVSQFSGEIPGCFKIIVPERGLKQDATKINTAQHLDAYRKCMFKNCHSDFAAKRDKITEFLQKHCASENNAAARSWINSLSTDAGLQIDSINQVIKSKPDSLILDWDWTLQHGNGIPYYLWLQLIVEAKIPAKDLATYVLGGPLRVKLLRKMFDSCRHVLVITAGSAVMAATVLLNAGIISSNTYVNSQVDRPSTVPGDLAVIYHLPTKRYPNKLEFVKKWMPVKRKLKAYASKSKQQ